MKQSRILFGWTLIFIAASISFLWVTGCPAEGSMPDASQGNVPTAVPLTGFTVTFDGDPLFSFLDETRAYSASATWQENDLSKQSLSISASAAEGSVIEILINGTSVAKEDNSTTVSTACAAPVAGTAALTITARAYKKGPVPINQKNYTATISPAKLSTPSINLMSLYIGHTSTSGNKLDPAFSASGITYEASADSGNTNGFIKADAASDAATVEIFIKDGARIAPPAAESSLDDNAEASFTMPATGGADVILEVKVTANITDQSGSHTSTKVYTVTVQGYQLQTVTYSGTVSIAASVTSAAGYENLVITGVTAISKDATQKAAQLDAGASTSSAWSFNAREDWTPAAFTVTLAKGDTEIESKSYPYNSASTTNIALQVANAGELGNRIYDANDFFYYLNNNSFKNTNFSLAKNINLAGYTEGGNPVAWNGPSGYSATLYGNGYTISGLQIAKNPGSASGPTAATALFNTLAGNAMIQDFTLEVSVAQSAKARNAPTYFGGLLGYVEDSGANITIKNIRVKGDLEFTKAVGGYFLVGGLVGEIKRAIKVTIENCVSEVNMILNDQNTAESNLDTGNYIRGMGGLVGRIGSTGSFSAVVEINNSYATGNVTVKDSAKNVRVFAGGLIGDIYRTNGTTTVTITNCYSSGAVSATNGYSSTHGAANYYTGAGGLVGCITDYNTGAGGVIVTIENSAAIGSSALFSVGNDGTPTVNGRFIGRPASETKAPTLTLSGNIAFKDMLVGTGSGSADGQTGAADDDPLAQGLTLQELKNPGVWSGSPLNWPSAVWDFSKVNAGTWPTLKQ